jgi:ribokinase
VNNAERCAKYFLQQGLENVIITLGDKGVVVATNKTTKHIPAYSVATKDSTGAGDAFVGSFAVFLAEGLSPAKAISRASLYATLSTKKVGTQKSYLPRSEFDGYSNSRTLAH